MSVEEVVDAETTELVDMRARSCCQTGTEDEKDKYQPSLWRARDGLQGALQGSHSITLEFIRRISADEPPTSTCLKPCHWFGGALLSAELLSQFALRHFQHFPLVSAQIIAGAIDVESEHGHPGDVVASHQEPVAITMPPSGRRIWRSR
jgi:hypothetical protein